MILITRVTADICPITKKRRRTEDVVPPSTLKRRLYAMLKEGRDTDVELLVPTDYGGVKRVEAHKLILVAMSPVIATKITRRWEEGGKGKDVIDIQLDVGVAAVERFLEFLYKEELPLDLSVELYLELVVLADHYKVENLMALCDRRLTDELDVENVIKVYQKSRTFQSLKCEKDAFNFLKKNLGRILASSSKEMEMDGCTWKSILESNYLPNVEEIELFKGLIRWKNENVEERTSDFQQLLKLVRIPIIDFKNFLKFVVPSEEFDSKLMLQVFLYYVGRGQAPEQFKNSPRNLLEPKNTEELQIFINGSQSGDIIELDGTYSHFVIHKNINNLTIRAKKGKEAILRDRFYGMRIYGSHCTIEGLSIILNSNEGYNPLKISSGVEIKEGASHNILKNITISKIRHGIIILGKKNYISNIIINDPKEKGVYFGAASSSNKMSNCSVLIGDKEVAACGFYIEGKGGNKLKNLVCKNAKSNEVRCSGNFIQGFEICGSFLDSGLTLFCGSNHIENVQITGEKPCLNVSYLTKNTTVVNCCAEMIRIKGERNKVENSKVREIFVGGKGQQFVNCEAEVLNVANGTEMETNGCVFKKTESVDCFA